MVAVPNSINTRAKSWTGGVRTTPPRERAKTGVEPSLDETKTSTSKMLFVGAVPPVFSGICSRN